MLFPPGAAQASKTVTPGSIGGEARHQCLGRILHDERPILVPGQLLRSAALDHQPRIEGGSLRGTTPLSQRRSCSSSSGNRAGWSTSEGRRLFHASSAFRLLRPEPLRPSDAPASPGGSSGRRGCRSDRSSTGRRGGSAADTRGASRWRTSRPSRRSCCGPVRRWSTPRRAAGCGPGRRAGRRRAGGHRAVRRRRSSSRDAPAARGGRRDRCGGAGPRRRVRGPGVGHSLAVLRAHDPGPDRRALPRGRREGSRNAAARGAETGRHAVLIPTLTPASPRSGSREPPLPAAACGPPDRPAARPPPRGASRRPWRPDRGPRRWRCSSGCRPRPAPS